MMCSRQVTRLLLRSASVTKDSALAASCGEPLAAGRVGRREEAQHRERHHAALIAAIVCRIWQYRTRISPCVRQRPPHFSNITETEAWHDFRCRAEERKLLCPKPLPALRIAGRVVLRSGSVPWGNCASPSPPSREEGVPLLEERTCNEVVRAHKEFLRARQTPVPLICIVC